MDYQNTLDKALSQLRALEIDEALRLLYMLLKENPEDFSLIARIYAIEAKKKNPLGFDKICRHIFSIESMSAKFHQLLISSWTDFKAKFGTSIDPAQYSKQQVFNLFYHLGQTGFKKDSDTFKDYIKRHLAEHRQTPSALFYYCEQLVEKKNLIEAKHELEYLMIYYTEATTTIPAQNLVKKIRDRIKISG